MPHPRVMMKVLPFYPPQWKKSLISRSFSFQMYQRQPFKKITFKDWMKPLDYLLDLICLQKKMSRYKLAWTQPGAITSMLNWYRGIKKAALKNRFQTNSRSCPHDLGNGGQVSKQKARKRNDQNLPKWTADFCR